MLRTQRTASHRILAMLLVWVVAALPAIGCAVELLRPSNLNNVEAAIRREFPEVKQVSTAQLSAWLNDQSYPSPLLLDVRTPDEYAVSHLRDACRVGPAAKHADVLATVPKDRLIVAYCSTGYRSSAFVRRLQKAGFTNVYNLEGSIFRWANEGRPVFRAGQQVYEVHPYNGTWGRLLDPSLHPRDHPYESTESSGKSKVLRCGPVTPEVTVASDVLGESVKCPELTATAAET